MAKWQFLFSDSILNAKNGGPVFVGARPNGRGAWMGGDELPNYIRQYLNITKTAVTWNWDGAINCADLRAQVDSNRDAQDKSEVHWHKRLCRLGTVCGTVNIPNPPKDKETGIVTPVSGQVTSLVIEQNEGRNLACFPVLSFGWKDADLDPEGCTGIRKITQSHLGGKLFVEVGGHKTFCYSEDDEDGEGVIASDEGDGFNAEWEFLCDACSGYSCDGDSEEFTASFRDTLTIRIRRGMGPEGLATAVIKAARERCEQFEREMAKISADFEKVNQEVPVNVDR